MSPKPVVSRALANQDVENAIAYYLKEGAQQAALAFVDALEDAYGILGRQPGIGTTRYAIELDIPGLRSWALPRFPYLIFYMERADHIDVWRVLHGRRDIPALIEDPDSEPD
jgi:toxin ParE1/3/4